MAIEMIGQFVGAIIIILLVSLGFRKLIIRLLKCGKATASTDFVRCRDSHYQCGRSFARR